jgi:aminopeptidase-like protein
MTLENIQLDQNDRDSEYAMLDCAFDNLFPLLRSITGPGLEKSLAYFEQYLPIVREKVPSGSSVFDWTVPKEWHLKSATLVGPDGEVIADVTVSNLHVVNYSHSIDQIIDLDILQSNLHSLSHLPSAIPYVTSYYNSTWGFCISDEVRKSLKPGKYHAKIDAEFIDGGVPFSTGVLKGESEKEILLTSYLCHPSLANNELSGPLVMLGLYHRILKWKKRRYSYRFLLNPETIGSLCFLSRYAKHLEENLLSGVILTCLGGDSDKVRIKNSREKKSLLDNCAKELKRTKGTKIVDFDPRGGSDERQFCAPGFNLPMLQAAKSIYGQYDGYHNSLDTKEYMSITSLQESIDELEELLLMGEYCGHPVNISPFGEPQLGKRELYSTLNSGNTWINSSDNLFDSRDFLNKLLSLLNYADGKHDLFDIANKLQCEVSDLYPIIDRLEQEDLLRYGVKVPSL